MAKADTLQRLCSMKRTVEFTPHQLETWLAALGTFSDEVVNEAVLTIGLQTDPFPDIGKLVCACQKIESRNQHIPYRDDSRPTRPTIRRIAEALCMKIGDR